jgi:hypothetical protein
MTPTEAMREVGVASRAFESRWTLRSLRLVDPELHQTFVEQQQLWEDALVTGDKSDIVEQTAAMVRGWLAATRRMEKAGADDCACTIGQCANTGLKVAIGFQIAAAERLAPGICFITPDEVAMLLASQREILKIKELFPGATVEDIARREDCP